MKEILLAAITSLPPTLVAVAALIKTAKLGRTTDQVNRAVNHQPADAPTLITRIISMESRLQQIEANTTNTTKTLSKLNAEQKRHLAWHQAQQEN
jgi:hypothetical protein